MWYNNTRSGHGINVFSDGSHYEGEWLDDKMHGQGKLYWTNGNHYEGEFSNGIICGHGILYTQNGTVTYEGNWTDNQNATDVIKTENGKKFRGVVNSRVFFVL